MNRQPYNVPRASFRRLCVCAAWLGVVAMTGCEQSEAPENTAHAGAAAQDSAHAAEASLTSAEPTDAVDARALLKFETLTYDFGVMSETETRDGTIRFTNAGHAPLKIEKITTTCGCTTAQPDRMTYQPGESGTISVQFDPSAPNDPGQPQRKYVNIFSNGAASPSGVTSVAILADVQAFIHMEPRFLQINDVRLGQPYHADVTLASPDPEFVIESVEPTNVDLRIEIIDVPPADAEAHSAQGSRPALTTRIIRVHVSPDAPWGSLFSWLTVTITGRPTAGAQPITHTARIRVQGQVFGEVAADPDTFRFGVMPGESFERELYIRHRDAQPFEIISATVECTATTTLRIEAQQATPNEWRIVLTGTARTSPGSARGSVRITTDIPGSEAEIDIPIIGVVRPP